MTDAQIKQVVAEWDEDVMAKIAQPELDDLAARIAVLCASAALQAKNEKREACVVEIPNPAKYVKKESR